ncbi:hypothetical protein B0I37DRAFT_214251 [Chaetomium sp. MPI-CAGE-AT-0009]|nr:hypothetical protein B0I37DRAFT_214251 [Chaetomium sp. MPI-CAGE-AT-0009]
MIRSPVAAANGGRSGVGRLPKDSKKSDDAGRMVGDDRCPMRRFVMVSCRRTGDGLLQSKMVRFGFLVDLPAVSPRIVVLGRFEWDLACVKAVCANQNVGFLSNFVHCLAKSLGLSVSGSAREDETQAGNFQAGKGCSRERAEDSREKGRKPSACARRSVKFCSIPAPFLDMEPVDRGSCKCVRDKRSTESPKGGFAKLGRRGL